ncbi:uncharacterized protein JN550_003215 [Neoarthrinium moseri]|uniref:uncharacterized protein n=1 Tax=Neoarthrinium moseri TaxID=1658444 RepID=UPI001FDC6999|nr:uncharacterized protein JN550_003215 [Neoarthrinium moseri]KAI1873946.1 hypothetical protein JN550_003215 [Neoarthrinium moseri]
MDRTIEGFDVVTNPADWDGPPQIQRLPNELLWKIQNDFLPLYDAVRLGICNHHLRQNTDVNVWTKARAAETGGAIKSYIAQTCDDERWEFLKELEPKLPSHELCHYCRIFHPRVDAPSLSLWRVFPDTASDSDCDSKEVQFQRWGIHWGFGFRDVYAVMSRHSFTADHGVPLAELCVSTDWTFSHAYRNLHNASRSPFKRFVSYTKLDAEAVINNGHLLVHRIQRLWVPIHIQGTDVLIRYGAGDSAGDFKICAHHGPQSGEMIWNFILPLREGLGCVLAAQSVFNSVDDGYFPLPRIIKRCEDCPTEYSISFHIHYDNSVEIILDVWQNLGTCQTPLAPGWLNCWGTLNPRFGVLPGEDTCRNIWFQSEVGYVGNETLFQTPAGQSATMHSSAKSVFKHWDQLLTDVDIQASLQQPRATPSLAVVPQLSRHHFRKLRSGFVDARYECNLRRPLPPFPFEFFGTNGRIPSNHLRYTRSSYYESSRLSTRDEAATAS